METFFQLSQWDEQDLTDMPWAAAVLAWISKQMSTPGSRFDARMQLDALRFHVALLEDEWAAREGRSAPLLSWVRALVYTVDDFFRDPDEYAQVVHERFCKVLPAIISEYAKRGSD